MDRLDKAITGWADELAHQARRVRMTDDQRSKILGDITAAVGAGMSVRDACEQAGITQPTYYAWRRKHSHRTPPQHKPTEATLDAGPDAADTPSDAILVPPSDAPVPLNLPSALAEVAIEAVIEAAREAIIVAIDEFKTGASVLDVSGVIKAVRQHDDVLRQLGCL